jgi:site-specific DNA recombinase
VSTSEQADEGYSIAAQIEATKNIARYSGYEVIDTYVDAGISGKSMENRPAFLKMLADAKSKKFDMIIVWKLNRLSRNHLDLLKIYEELEACNVSFKSVSEPFDTGNPAGKLLFNMLASIGEFERETIVENVKNGMKQKAKEGFFNGGRMLGYESKAIVGDVKNKLSIIEEEAIIVRLIFELYTKGKGYKYISSKLNALNYKTIKGNLFNIQAVRGIITNPTYAGKIRFNKYVDHKKNRRRGNKSEFVLAVGQHEPIIDSETWNKAESLLKERTGRSKKIHKGVFLLTGLLKCPVCGSSMVAGRVTRKNNDGTKTKYNYYQCSRYKNYGRHECSANSVKAEYAEKYVLDRIAGFAFDDELIEEVVNGINNSVESTVKPIMKRIEQLDKDMQSYSDKKERIFRLYEDNIIDQITLKARIDKLEQEYQETKNHKEYLMEQIDKTQVVKEIPIKLVQDLLSNLGRVLDVSSREQTKMILNMVVEQISVDGKKKINEIKLRFNESSQKIFTAEESSDEDSSIFMSFTVSI